MSYIKTKTLIIGSLTAFFLGLTLSAEVPTLRILNWSEYIDFDLDDRSQSTLAERSPTLRGFQEAFQCRIEYTEFETETEAMRLLTQTPGYYDLIIIDSSSAENLIDAQLASAPDPNQIPNFKYIDPVLVNTLESDGIPYLYGSTGIIYRKDLYPNGIHSWKQFFDPKNPHQVSVLAEPKSAFSQALVALGADPVAPTEHEIRSAAKFLKHSTDADHIRFVTSDIELIQESILNGELGAAVIYSGDALSVIEENTHVAFVHPEEGFEIFMDCLLTVNGGSNPGLAHAFINYVLSPEIHARLAKELFYASPNSASLKLLETTAPEQLNNPAIYPSKALRAKGYPLKLNHSLVDRLGKILFNL